MQLYLSNNIYSINKSYYLIDNLKTMYSLPNEVFCGTKRMHDMGSPICLKAYCRPICELFSQI